MKPVPIVLGVALMLLGVIGSPGAEDREASRWFSVSWTPATDGTIARIRGQVRNTSSYRVTNVRLQIDGLNSDNGPAGRKLAWAIGDIEPGGTTFFSIEPIPGSASYQIRVISWDLVSGPETP
jgi:hypothetical protein